LNYTRWVMLLNPALHQRINYRLSYR